MHSALCLLDDAIAEKVREKGIGMKRKREQYRPRADPQYFSDNSPASILLSLEIVSALLRLGDQTIDICSSHMDYDLL